MEFNSIDRKWKQSGADVSGTDGFGGDAGPSGNGHHLLLLGILLQPDPPEEKTLPGTQRTR